MDHALVTRILDRYSYYRTCSLDNLKEECVTFIRHKDLRGKLYGAPETLVVIAPPGLGLDRVGPFTVYEDAAPELCFTLVHHVLSANAVCPEDVISPEAVIHPTAVVGTDGLKMVRRPEGGRVFFKHVGNVVVEDFARIGAQSVIHRACLDSTRIGMGAGHNAEIGNKTIVTAGVMVGGSAVIGKDCFVGMGAVIRNGVHIASKTFIGAGSVVTKNIRRPGVYFGSPARYVRPWDGHWETKEGDLK